MANLLKFFRVEALPTTGVVGGLYFVHGGEIAAGNGKLYVCTAADTFELYSGVNESELSNKLRDYVLKTQKIAGVDLQDDITADELKAALGLNDTNLGGEANVLEGVKVNGEALTIAADKTVDILVAEGSADGTISVNGKDVAVHGLGSAAYTDAGAYDAAGAAAQALQDAKDYADSLPHENTTYTFANGTELGQFTVTPSNGTAQTVTVGGLGTAASKSEGYFVKSEGYVAYSEAEKTKLAGIEAGAEVNIIETVKVNGVALTPDADRAVDVLIPDAAVKGVKSGDTVLALDPTDGMLSTTISMSYSSTSEGGDGYIYLKGINNAELGKINAAEFVKDGMIESVVMGENNVLTITWNTASGKTEATTIDFSKYIDTFTHYGATKGIAIENEKYVGVVDGTSEAFLTVGEDGFKLSGVQTAINTAAAKATTVVVEGTDTGNNLSIVETAGEDGHSIYTVNLTDVASAQALATLDAEVQEHEQVVAGALNDLNDRMTTAEGSVADHETRLATAEGEIDALQATVGGLDLGVKTVKGQGGEYVTVTPTEASKGDVTVSVSVATTKATNPAYTNDALATNGYVEEQAAAAESNAKTYADNLMSWVEF